MDKTKGEPVISVQSEKNEGEKVAEDKPKPETDVQETKEEVKKEGETTAAEEGGVLLKCSHTLFLLCLFSK